MNNRNAMGRLSVGLMLVGATLLGSASQSRAGDLVIDTGASTLSSDSITNSGGLTKIGSGTLILVGSNTYSGATVVSNGMVKLGAQGLNILQSGGTATEESHWNGRNYILAINGSGMTPNSPVVTSSTASNVADNNMWLSNTAHTNTWIAFDLGATNTISGFHYWNYNEVNLSGRGIKTAAICTGNSLPTTGDAYTNQGAAWGTVVTNITLDQAPGANGYTGSGVSFSTPVTTRYIEFWVTSNYGDPSYAGLSEILFQVSGAYGFLPFSSALSIASGASFDLAGFPQTVASLADVGAGGGSVFNSGAVATLTINPSSGSYSFSGVIGTNLSLIKSGSGTQILAGANTYTGSTTISNGMLTIGGSGMLGNGSYANTITNNAAFNCASSTNQILSGVISGTGSLIKSGVGTLTLAGSNTYSGATLINGGTVNFLKSSTVQGINYFKITGDADSGLSTNNIYTHAINFNGSGVVNVNGIPFSPMGANTQGPGDLAHQSYAGTSGSVTISNSIGSSFLGTSVASGDWSGMAAGGLYNVLKTLIFSGNDRTNVLNGLSENTWYDVRLYHRPWGASGRNFSVNYDVGNNGSVEYSSPIIDEDAPQNTPALAALGIAQTNTWAMSYVFKTGSGETNILLRILNTSQYHAYAITCQKIDPRAAGIRGTLPIGTTLAIANGATLDLDRSTQTVANLQGGDGTLTNGTLTVTGAFVPGGTNAVGTLSVSLLGANLIMADNSTYLGEYNATTSDVVCVNGQLNVGANCTVTLNPLNGAAPPSRVTLFTYGTLANPGNLATWTVTGQDVSKCRTSIGYDATSVYVNIARRGTTITLY